MEGLELHNLLLWSGTISQACSWVPLTVLAPETLHDYRSVRFYDFVITITKVSIPIDTMLKETQLPLKKNPLYPRGEMKTKIVK